MRWRRRTVPVGLATDEPDRRAPLTAAVPSGLTGFDFEVRCTVVWNASQAWRQKAHQAVAAHATRLLGGYSPTHANLTRIQLAADLAAGSTLSDAPPTRVWAEDVIVTVDPDQFELAQQHAQRLREREVATAGHEVERAELAYLKSTVFKNTASAALRWLRHHDHDVSGLNSVVRDLEHTVKIVAGDDPGPVETLITTFDALAPDLDRIPPDSRRKRGTRNHELLAHRRAAAGPGLRGRSRKRATSPLSQAVAGMWLTSKIILGHIFTVDLP